jgi:hypothetical protein
MKYDLSDIMKRAHNLYKTGKYTWSESLRKSWKMAKFTLRTREEIVNMVDYKSIDNKAFADKLRKEHEGWKPAERSKYDDFSAPVSAYYTNNNRGRFGSCFVGD